MEVGEGRCRKVAMRCTSLLDAPMEVGRLSAVDER